MAINVIIDSVTYSIPELGERSWGQDTTDLLEVLGNAAYKIKGGLIPLATEADFGPTAGLKALWFKSQTSNPASAGVVRLANLDAINWRDSTNNTDLTLTVDASDKLTFDGSEVLDTDNTATVTNKTIDADNNTITNIGDEEIKAGVDAAKIHDGSVSNTEFGYLDGVTSSIQTQIDSKAADADLTAHLNDTVDAHDASAISYDNATSGLAATEVQAAIDEVDGDLDVHIADGAIHFTEASIDHTNISNVGTNTHAQIDAHITTSAAHIAATAAHGVSEVMGTSGSTLQSVTYLTTDKSDNSDDFELAPSSIITRLTGFTADRAMSSINPISTKVLILANDTSYKLTVKNEDTGATAARRILTGTGRDLSVASGASISLVYDSTESRWRVVGGAGSGGLSTQGVSSATTAEVSLHYLVDTSGGAFTITLPTGSEGSVIRFTDATESWGTDPLTIAPATGEAIDGQAANETLVLDVTGTWVQFMWDNSVGQWVTDDIFAAYGDVRVSGSSGKNYVLNPDAATNTDDVTGDSGFSVTRTTTAAELAEESKGTGFLISGSGLTAGTSKVAWAILATGIDDADGGVFGRAKCSILDTSGAVNGDVTIQVYDVDNSVYVGDSDTITGTGTYYLDVPFRAGGDYEFHVIAVGTSVSEFTASGVTIEPVSQTVAGVTSKWQSYTPSNTQGFGTISSNNLQWRINGQNVEIIGDFTSGTVTGDEAQLELPNSYTISYEGSTSAQLVGFFNKAASSVGQQQNVLATHGDTYLNFAGNANNAANTALAPAAANSLIGSSQRASFIISVPVAELANNYTPTITDAWYQNLRFSAYSQNESVGNTSIVPFATADYNLGGGSFSSGQYTVPVDGYYRVTAQMRFNATASQTWGIYKNGSIVGIGTIPSGDGIIVNKTVYASAGDTLDVRNASGATRTTANFANQSSLEVVRVSDYSVRKASLPFNRWQEKAVGSDVTTNGTFTTFNNLVIGKHYNIFGSYHCTVNNTDTLIQVFIKHDGNTIDGGRFQVPSGAGAKQGTLRLGNIFKATATTVTVETASASANAKLNADTTSERCFTTLEELSMYVDETTDFT
jgi:hypothetical protein